MPTSRRNATNRPASRSSPRRPILTEQNPSAARSGDPSGSLAARLPPGHCMTIVGIDLELPCPGARRP